MYMLLEISLKFNSYWWQLKLTFNNFYSIKTDFKPNFVLDVFSKVLSCRGFSIKKNKPNPIINQNFQILKQYFNISIYGMKYLCI